MQAKNYLNRIILVLIIVTLHIPLANSNDSFDKTILTSDFVGWGVSPTNTQSSINLLNAWKQSNMKKDVVVAVIDTGIDPIHPFLRNNIYVENGIASTINFGVDFSKNHKEKLMPTDDHGHGTHVSGIIKSVFPKVKIMALKYYNPSASGKDNLKSTVEALRYAVDHNVDIINYSGGGSDPDVEELKILKEAEKKGIVVVAAAGNEESNIDIKSNAYFPASYGLSNIVTVSAYGPNLRILSSANYGEKSVDVLAPGQRIKSSMPHGRSGFLTGTSQATAFVSGVAALIKANFPDMSAHQIKGAIVQSSKTEVTLEGKTRSNGRVDAAKAIELANSMVPKLEVKQPAPRKIATKNVSPIHLPTNNNGKIIYRFK